MTMDKKRGAFIVLEGIDGSGKTTQFDLLCRFLEEQDLPIYKTSQPTGGPIGLLIQRRLRKEWHANPEALQLLFTADRSHHLAEEIIPALEASKHVICDRYALSTIAYGALQIEDISHIERMNRSFLVPDLVIFVRVSPETAFRRVSARAKGLSIFETRERLGRIAAEYERLAKDYPNVAVVDGERNIDEVQDEIRELVLARIANREREV